MPLILSRQFKVQSNGFFVTYCFSLKKHFLFCSTIDRSVIFLVKGKVIQLVIDLLCLYISQSYFHHWYLCSVIFQITPSKYMFDMQMDTEQKLANTHTMKVPRKIELLDMADTSLQKVLFSLYMLYSLITRAVKQLNITQNCSFSDL